MTENSQALAAGTRLQSSKRTYTIESMLGQGGFGITYLATTEMRMEHFEVEVKCALKEFFVGDMCERAEGSSDVKSYARLSERVKTLRKGFLSEAHRLEKISGLSRNVVRVSEVFEANSTAYYVMEYINGPTLSSYIRDKGRLTDREVKRILGPISNALRVLHDNRMTHLDVKPENIMLATEKNGALRPVLIDFGLAKHYDEKGNATSTLNAMGFSDGYAPIEQYTGITTFSPESDVYALAATMYHALTGHRLPKASEVDLNEVAKNLAGSEFRDWILAALSPVRKARPALWRPIDAVRPTVTPKRSAGAKSKTWMYWLVSAIAMAALALIAVVALKPSKSAKTPPAPPVPSVLPTVELSLPENVNVGKTFSIDIIIDNPDGEVSILDAPVLNGCTLKSGPATSPTDYGVAYSYSYVAKTAGTVHVSPIDVRVGSNVYQSPEGSFAIVPNRGRTSPTPTCEQLGQGHVQPGDFELCASNGRHSHYFTEDEWDKLENKGAWLPQGIYLQGFLVSLSDEGGVSSWEEAKKYDLPTKTQGQILGEYRYQLNRALSDFGGIKMNNGNNPWYWTCTPCDDAPSPAWYVNMRDGNVLNESDYPFRRVRTVSNASRCPQAKN